MGPIDDVERGVAVFRDASAGLTVDEFRRPTPCAGWDVRALVGHVLGLYQGVVDSLHGARVDLVAASADPGGDAARAVDDAADAMLRAWREPGALDRTLATTVSEMPSALATRIVIGDSMLHAWDLARARDVTVSMPDDLAEAQLAMMQQYYDPAVRGPSRGFELAVEWPDDSPVQERLVALSGRDPAWTP